MDKDLLLDSLHRDAAALAEVARLGLTQPVPSCPGWSVADLVAHTGAVHRSQAKIVRTLAQEPPSGGRELFESLPGLLSWLESSALFGGTSDLEHIPDGLVEWFEDGAAELESALREVDPSEPVWSWSETKQVAHYLRMMPIETAVHRWDAQLAHDRAEPIDKELAAVGIGHTFEVMVPMRRSRMDSRTGEGERYLFTQSDGPGVWSVRFDHEGVAFDREAAAADVSVRGTASDLLLFLWQRLPGSRLDVEGDSALVDRYFELVPPI